ncbi:hypothetical protein COK73_21840 [Bacillus cereus]|nr:hypothetical protein CN393_29775 [Bacillus cereus]PFT67624.1 hypothetical protein COK73_21840 [Bacillus cereus]
MGPFKSQHEKMKCTLIPFIPRGFGFCSIFFKDMISLWIFMFRINKKKSCKMLINVVLMGLEAYFYKNIRDMIGLWIFIFLFIIIYMKIVNKH